MSCILFLLIECYASSCCYCFALHTDLLNKDNASYCLEKLINVYNHLTNNIQKQLLKEFIGEHYQVAGLWQYVSPKGRFNNVLPKKQLEFIYDLYGKPNLKERDNYIKQMKKLHIK